MIETRKSKIAFLLPALTWIFAVSIFPLIFTVGLSLFHWNLGYSLPTFNGIANYLEILSDSRFWNSVKISVIFTVVTLTLEFTLALALATLLNTEIKGVNILKPLCTIPLFASPIAIAFISVVIFNEQYGPINAFMNFLGFGPVRWISSAWGGMISIMLVDIWQWTPFIFLMLLAGMQSLPADPLEAAKIDGASKLQSFRFVTLPMLRPVMTFAFLFKLIESFKAFDVAFVLTGGGPGVSTELYSLHVYRVALKYFQIGKGCSLSVLLLLAVTLIAIKFLKQFGSIWEGS